MPRAHVVLVHGLRTSATMWRRQVAALARHDLDVVDDGVGFDPRAAQREEVDGIAFGLRAMRQRAERQGGSIEIESAPGEGTAVSARIPLEAP